MPIWPLKCSWPDFKLRLNTDPKVFRKDCFEFNDNVISNDVFKEHQISS